MYTPSNFVLITGVMYLIFGSLLIVSSVCLRDNNHKTCINLYGSTNTIGTWLMFCISNIILITITMGVIFKYSKVSNNCIRTVSLKNRKYDALAVYRIYNDTHNDDNDINYDEYL